MKPLAPLRIVVALLAGALFGFGLSLSGMLDVYKRHVVISLGLQGQDGLRLCSQLRSLERTRNISVLLMGEAEDRELSLIHI